MDFKRHLYERFPEALFSTSSPLEYNRSLLLGMELSSKANVVITGLCRNINSILDHSMARLYKTASLFNDYRFVIYENDSDDGTSERLREYKSKDNKFFLLQENTGHKQFGPTREVERPKYLGSLRNICQDYIINLGQSFRIDYVIVIDLDLEGGWSYDGILNTFAHSCSDWDAMTANGIQFRERTVTLKRADQPDESVSEVERLFFDTWAYRNYGDEALKICDIVNLYRFERGEAPIGVFSNFNGLGIYRFESIKGISFDAEENEDGTVTNEWSYYHREMRKLGKKIFLNPSLITLYSPHEFSVNI